MLGIMAILTSRQRFFCFHSLTINYVNYVQVCRGVSMAVNLRYLDAIKDHVLIYDGAMGTSIQRYQLTAQDFGGEKAKRLQRLSGHHPALM